jgi:hypothetical protein
MAQIFISYAREDYKIAKQIYDFLVLQGQEPWFDKERLLPGQKWESAIQSAIRESHFFIALLSPNSIEKRGYVQKELRAGLDMLDKIPDSQIFLIPVRLAECEPIHERLRELQWLDLFPDLEDGLRRLNKVFTFVPNDILTSNLSGSKWTITTSTVPKPWILFFREGGVLEYDRRGKHYGNGTWRQRGETIYLEFNRNYAQYKGVIDRNKITGEAQNIVGDEWRWEAVRIEE